MKIRIPLAISLLAFLITPVIQSTARAQKSGPATPSKASSDASLASGFDKVPLSFEANQGQSDPSVKFSSRGNGYSLFLTDSSAVLVLSAPAGSGHRSPLKRGSPKQTKHDVLRMELSGAATNPHVSGEDQLPNRANYFIGNDPSKWHAGLPTYARVRYQDIYPGVDVVYYGNQRKLEYDFIVSANADPSLVRLRFQGAERLRVTPSGDLDVHGRNGEIAFHKPVVYQVKDGVREPVEGRFQRLAGDHVGFELGSYDHNRALVIDPALAYSTYLGGSGGDGIYGGDSGNAVTVDAAGDAYIVGATVSPDFPVTANAFQKMNNGMAYDNGIYLNNAFITKFDPKGSTLIYSTYLGGTTSDEGEGNYDGDLATAIAIDAAGNAYVAGTTSSYNFPVTSNAYQKTNKAYTSEVGTNAFVTKLNATGSALLYSTYFGGSGGYREDLNVYYGETTAGIAIDAAGDAYIAGTTYSSDLPVTSTAFQTVNNASPFGSNFFVTEFNPSGSALVYSTYLGGSGINDGREVTADSAAGIAIDSGGDAYVTGIAYSRDFPVAGNAYQKTNNSFYYPESGAGGSNAVISELNPAGSALVYSTYLGGNNVDGGNAIALDASDNAYITGAASSTNFPTTPGAFQTTLTGNGQYNQNVFVTELNPTGSALVYSTLIGGKDGLESGNSIALDAFGSAYVTGTTTSTSFPVTSDAFRKANHSPSSGNVFFSKLNPAGSALLYSTYLGGAGGQYGGDAGRGIAVDPFGAAYITGATCSADFPLAGTPVQSVNKEYSTTGSGCTAFLSKFIINIITRTTLTADSTPVTAGTLTTFTADVVPNTGDSVPTGSVVFGVDGVQQTPASLDGSGEASFSTSALTAGRHTITAAYSGNPTIAGSSASLGLTVIGPPARIGVASGDYQSVPVNTAFPEPLVVEVHDANGLPVPGVAVTFTSSSGVSWSANPVLTDGSGLAATTPTFNSGGPQTVTASVNHVSIPATFIETVDWSDVIKVVSGNNQVVVSGNAFPDPLVVQVTNLNGVPLSGQTVHFAGVPFAANSVIATDANGMASDQILLIRAPGFYFADAYTDHTPNPAQFDLTVQPANMQSAP